MALTNTDAQFLSDLGAAPTGQHTEQVVTATGDQSGNRAAAKAAAMHGQRATSLDAQAQRATERAAARQERGATAIPEALANATDIRAARAAMRAARRQRKQA